MAANTKRKTMKKLNKVALLIASATVAFAASAQSNDNWVNGSGDLQWKNGDGSLCWRDAGWTPATAGKDCDGAIVPAAAPAAAPAPAPAARSRCTCRRTGSCASSCTCCHQGDVRCRRLL